MSVFDPAIVEEAFGDDRASLAAFLRSVQNSLRTGYGKLQAAVDGGDAKALMQVAHALKGSSGHLGGARFAQIAQRLETAGRAGGAAAAGDVQALRVALAELEKAIDDYVARLESPEAS